MTEAASENAGTFKRALTSYDVTNVTVGAIVGADIYIAAAVTAGLLGPASLLAWAVAGVLATIIALTLAECAQLVSVVGGPYAYTAHAFGHFVGFLAGWSMWIAELSALPVFAIAFTNYLGYFQHLDSFSTHTIRIVFLALLTMVNVVSVRAAGRLNDALTGLKLAPLLAMIVGGAVYIAFHLHSAADHLTPFAPFGLHNFPKGLLLVFWAYVGFELSTVPAGEVENPGKTIPRALATGMVIVTLFYMSTNIVLYAIISHRDLAGSPIPLVAAGSVLFGSVGAAMMAAGAMISVSGSDESDMLGSSRLGYAMAADGMLPHALASIHPRFSTPWVALLAQSLLASALTFVNNISDLISFAVFNLAFSFLLCALALVKIRRDLSAKPTTFKRALPILAVVICVVLLAATSLSDKLTGIGILVVGAAIYLVAAPRETLPHALAQLHERERLLERLARQRMRFLGAPLGWLGRHGTPPRP